MYCILAQRSQQYIYTYASAKNAVKKWCQFQVNAVNATQV